jgi:hypothetical protein
MRCTVRLFTEQAFPCAVNIVFADRTHGIFSFIVPQEKYPYDDHCDYAKSDSHGNLRSLSVSVYYLTIKKVLLSITENLPFSRVV